MGFLALFTLSAGFFVGVLGYTPLEVKDHFLNADFLRDVVDRINKELSETADTYMEFPDQDRLSGPLDLENEEPSYRSYYDPLGENRRDSEYLQQSSLWGHQFVAGGAGEGKQRLKPDGSVKNQQQIKTDATLPAYCNPPNPCPVGYGADDGCLEEFENSAAFSRDYQSSQDCMCDSEHMFDCAAREYQNPSNQLRRAFDIDRIMDQFTIPETHKNLVAKKYFIEKDENENPFLQGEKLPVAAKKGSHIVV